MPLSHSSAKTLLGCEQRYAYYKIEKAPDDKDYEKSDALAVGSAFHWILENSKHEKPVSITADFEHCYKDKDIRLSPDDAPLVHAMVLKYLRLHQKMGFRLLAVETELKTDIFHGFVDALLEDKEEKWWITDLKTYKTLFMPGLRALARDPQLNLYAAHAPLLAEIHNLDMRRFGGVRWRVVTKSTAKPKASESTAEFIMRLVEKHVSAHDIAIPAALLAPDERAATHERLWKRTQEIKAGAVPIKNFDNCMSFYSPCNYWSRCHGKNYSDMGDSVQITTED